MFNAKVIIDKKPGVSIKFCTKYTRKFCQIPYIEAAFRSHWMRYSNSSSL